MIRAVVDSSVYVSAALGRPDSAPSAVLEAWEDGSFELVVSPDLIAELSGVLRRPKFERFITAAEVGELMSQLEGGATLVADPPPRSEAITRDPDDDYLVALARAAGAVLVSVDRDLLEAPVDDVEILSPRQFLDRLSA